MEGWHGISGCQVGLNGDLSGLGLESARLQALPDQEPAQPAFHLGCPWREAGVRRGQSRHETSSIWIRFPPLVSDSWQPQRDLSAGSSSEAHGSRGLVAYRKTGGLVRNSARSARTGIAGGVE